MPRKSKYTDEQKKAYFDNIRKNDPKRLCNHCNRHAVNWDDGKQVCGWHIAGTALTPTSEKLGAKATIDMLVLLLEEAAFALSGVGAHRLLLLKIVETCKKVRPEGIKEKS